MHKLSLCLAIVGVGFLAMPARAEKWVQEDKNGNRIGSYETRGSRIVELDKNGNVRGYSMQQGNAEVLFDKNGNRTGSIKKQ